MAVNATAIWRARPSGSNANGGGYDAGISGAATDYSQQNAAQASGTHGSGSGTTTFTDSTAAAFTSAMVGNAINISGQGVYFVITFTNASNVVVDRALGTFSGASWSLGGGWADFWTNTSQTASIIVPGNKVFILGSGIPNPSSYVADYTFTGSGTGATSVDGNSSAGKIYYLNDPSTPSYKAPPDTTGGMPVISSDGALFKFPDPAFASFQGLWFIQTDNQGSRVIGSSQYTDIIGCVCDTQAKPNAFFQPNGNGCSVMGCEVFSSTGGGLFNGVGAIGIQGNGLVTGCNVHDVNSHGLSLSGNNNQVVSGNIIAKCVGDGIQVSNNSIFVWNNTIDGNGGHGINIDSNSELQGLHCFNNIITNQTTAGKYGITVGSGTTAVNDLVKAVVDYNSFYNNTANYNAISAGTHDTALGSSPYVASSTENYTLA